MRPRISLPHLPEPVHRARVATTTAARRTAVRVLTGASSIPVVRPVAERGMRLVFDAVAPDWSKIRADPSYSDGFMEALTYLPREFRPPQILDASCGHGLASSLLVERWPDRSVTGVDISPRMVDIARKHVPDATFLVGSVHHLPFEDGAFDLITSLDGLVDPAEFMRVLHRKGRILIVYSMRATTPISRNLDDLAAAFATHGGNATAHLDGMAHALVVRHRR